MYCGLLSMLFYRTQNHLPRGGTAYCGMGPPTSIIKTIPDRLAYYQVHEGIFLLSCESLFSDDSNLHRVDIKLASTLNKWDLGGPLEGMTVVRYLKLEQTCCRGESEASVGETS